MLISPREFDVMDAVQERARLAKSMAVSRYFRAHVQSRHFCAIVHNGIFQNGLSEADDNELDDGL